MNEATARARLRIDVQADLAPALTVAEVDDLLLRTRVTDAAGVDPEDAGYVPTWSDSSVNRAIAAGLRIKAAKVLVEFDVAIDGGGRFQRSQKQKQLLDMAAIYDRKAGGGITSVSVARFG